MTRKMDVCMSAQHIFPLIFQRVQISEMKVYICFTGFVGQRLLNNVLETRKMSFSGFLCYLTQTNVFLLPHYCEEVLTRELGGWFGFVFCEKPYK